MSKRRRETKNGGIPEKKRGGGGVGRKNPRVRVKNEISSEKTQCDVFFCIQVTPSIKCEVNLDMRYKAQLQRKGEGLQSFAKT